MFKKNYSNPAHFVASIALVPTALRALKASAKESVHEFKENVKEEIEWRKSTVERMYPTK